MPDEPESLRVDILADGAFTDDDAVTAGRELVRQLESAGVEVDGQGWQRGIVDITLVVDGEAEPIVERVEAIAKQLGITDRIRLVR